jgi:hypothetical protein
MEGGIMVKSEDIDWSQVTDLGEIPDRTIAERLGCSKHVIWRKRRLLGIPGCKRSSWKARVPRINWDEVRDLGKTSCVKIAQRLGCSNSQVLQACNARNIKVKGGHIDWNNVQDLGKTWDTTIAKRLGCSQTAISRARTRLGIPPYKLATTCIYCGQPFIAYKSSSNACSLKCGDLAQSIARSLSLDGVEGLNPFIVAAFQRTVEYRHKYVQFGGRKGIDWDTVTDLGLLPDSEIAKRLNCTKSNVSSARYTRRIPSALSRKKERENGKSARN